MLWWIEILAAIVGVIGVVLAFVLGYRAPHAEEPEFEIAVDEGASGRDGATAVLTVHNPGGHPLHLRSLVLQSPGRGVYFVEEGRGDDAGQAFEADVVTFDTMIRPETWEEFEVYLGVDRDSARKNVMVDVEFSTSPEPDVVKAETLRLALPKAGTERRRLAMFRDRPSEAG